MADLFGTEAPRKRTPASQDGAVKRLIDQYHREFVARFGIKPKIHGGKDGTLLKGLVATWGEAEVSALLARFVNERDTRIPWANWADKTGWSIAAFAHVAQSMLTSSRQQGVDDTTAGNIAAARAATRQRK